MEYRYPPLVKSSLYSTSLLWKTYTVLIFANQKKSKEGFHSYKNKVRRENNMQSVSALQGAAQRPWLRSRVALPRICARHRSAALPQPWSASVLHRDLLQASRASPWLSGEECTCLAGNARDLGSVPGWGRSPAGRNGNPLQYPCLGIPMHRGAWRATVHRVTKSRTWQSSKIHTLCIH